MNAILRLSKNSSKNSGAAGLNSVADDAAKAAARLVMERRDYLPWRDVEAAKRVLGIVEPSAAEMMAAARAELAARGAL